VKCIYTVITPEGQEFVLGLYATDATATRAFTRKYAADWRAFAGGPFRQREPKPGESIKPGDAWTWAS